MKAKHHDVFISHSSKDKAVADAVCARLESQGVRCWIAPRDILPGTNWGDAIVQAIGDSLVMVVVFSSHANKSQQVSFEVERAVGKEVIILPFRVEQALPSGMMELFLSNTHWLDALTPPLESHLQHLVETVQVLLDGKRKVAAGLRPAGPEEPGGQRTAAVSRKPFPLPLTVDESGSALEELPIEENLQIRRIRYAARATPLDALPRALAEPSLPRRFDPDEAKWKLDTKSLGERLEPAAVPGTLELLVQPALPGGSIYALAAVDEFYLLSSTAVVSLDETPVADCRIGRPGIAEFTSWTKAKRLAVVKRDTHPYVLGDGRGALNLLFLIQVTEQRRVRSEFYPVVRQGFLTPEDIYAWKGYCLVSPDGRRIALQSPAPGGNRSSVYTCEIDGTACRHVAGALATSTVLCQPGKKQPAGWTDEGQLKVFVKDAAANAWRPCVLEDTENARPVYF